jgi:biotin carboxyl carrier protein
MELIVLRGDRQETVTVRRTDGGSANPGAGYEVTIGDRTYRVDARSTRPVAGAWLLSMRIDGGRHHEVAVHRDAGSRGAASGTYQVAVGSVADTVEVLDPLTHRARVAHEAVGRGGAERVTAYMPGRVVDVLVEEGAEVEAGQGVVVLEAMKMENEIQAEHPGVIRKLFVEAGQTVEGGDPLFEIE